MLLRNSNELLFGLSSALADKDLHLVLSQVKVFSTVGNEQPASKRVKSRKPDALDEH